MPRPSTPILSAQIIGEAGLELSKAGAPFGVNAIARRLAVRPSSLYNHVDGMDGIIELMRGQLVAGHRVERADESWEAYLRRTLDEQRLMYAEHPSLVPLLIGKPITHPAVIEAYDDLATVFIEGGFPEADVLPIIALVDAFAIGFGLDLASPEEIWQPDGETRTIGRLIENGERGRVRADHAFEFGVRMLIEGLRAHLTA